MAGRPGFGWEMPCSESSCEVRAEPQCQAVWGSRLCAWAEGMLGSNPLPCSAGTGCLYVGGEVSHHGPLGWPPVRG